MLDDVQIRRALKEFLLTRGRFPKLLVEELRIHNGNSIADVVTIHKYMHGYEIKGSRDSVSRLKTQLEFYQLSFPTVTLVLTTKHQKWAEKNLPKHWGILLAFKTNTDEIKFKYLRRSRFNPTFVVNTSLTMLWKNELLKITNGIPEVNAKTKDSRLDLVEKISPKLNKNLTAELLSKAILDRHS